MTPAHRFKTCTGSPGSSHHPCISPEPLCALFGLCILPSAKCFFQFDPVRIAGSCSWLPTVDGAADVGERGDAAALVPGYE